MITLRFSTIDGVRKTHKYSTLAGARKKALSWVGPVDSTSGSYAVSSDGVVKVTCKGCTLTELFSTEPVKGKPVPGERFFIICDYEGGHWPGAYSTREEALVALAKIEETDDAGIQEYMYDEHGGVVSVPVIRTIEQEECPF